ncbi:hypothetical protein Cgig2_002595 [Carnegiea gigantea]|uniref:Uncharacterized protein n=1 Tax=Carnegiea gigantea TaxID=171969 RepID=A0A9Q1JK08_9CARY|nr:hypothetical protein Cgig2_002595 [Carnegiea gigantea]
MHAVAVGCSEKAIASKFACSVLLAILTKLDSELSQDELTIYEYVFGKVKDVDDRASVVTLRPGEQLEVNVINIWSNILNNRETKRDLASPSRLFIETLKASSFKKRYEDFKAVTDKELERCQWIKIKQVELSKVLSMYLECVEHPKHAILKNMKATCLKML